jgi:hypothetical protein
MGKLTITARTSHFKRSWSAIYVAGYSLVVLLAGCANIPSPNYVGKDGDDSRITVDDLVGHIQCELIKAKQFDTLAASKYRVQATLTLKVEDNAGLSPSLSFINPYEVAGTSLTYGVGGALNVSRQRIFTGQYTIASEKLIDSALRTNYDCSPADKLTLNISGDLGIGGIIAAGMDATKYKSVNVSPPAPPAATQNVTVNVILDPNRPATTPPNVEIVPPVPQVEKPTEPIPPSFGSTVQFTIVKSANAGPTWVVKHFKGPSGQTGLISAGRTDTDTLVLAFAPAGAPPIKLSPMFLPLGGAALTATTTFLQAQADAAAEARAQNELQSLTTSMILQNLGALQGF